MNLLLCAEVNILWAAHQVHHTSEEFNMSIGVRHSALQALSVWVGVCTLIEYLLIDQQRDVVVVFGLDTFCQFEATTQQSLTKGTRNLSLQSTRTAGEVMAISNSRTLA